MLVTGGTGVLGRAIVNKLTDVGYHVTATYWHHPDQAQRLRSRTGCQLVPTDGRDEQQVAKLWSDGGFKHVVHCLGTNRDGLLLRQTQALWKQALQDNADSAFLTVRAALQHLPSGGHILVLGSRVGCHGNAGQSAYAAAKGAVAGMVGAAALEGSQRGLVVNCIFPGFVPSALSQGSSPYQMATRYQQNMVARADAALSLAEFVAWELENNRTSGQVFRPDCRLDGIGGPS